VRIAIVNDVQMAVEALRRGIRSWPEHQIAWVAWNGEEAVQRCKEDTPDLILMDLIMPVMNGVEATRRIMASNPCPILIVTNSVNTNAALVFEAMGAGALDAIKTPVFERQGVKEGSGFDGVLSKINTIHKLTKNNAKKLIAAPAEKQVITSSVTHCPLVAIGSSSGGPLALATVLAALPADFPAATVIVQHVDEHFARQLTLWLDEQSDLPIAVAREGTVPRSGTVLVAATNDHLAVGTDGTLVYTPHPREYVYRPSVDVFFESVAKHWHNRVIGVLLTGMGRDGAAGLLKLRQMGYHTIAQDKATSAVYGMPKAAAEINAAAEILPINEISRALMEFAQNEALDQEVTTS
jgi:two-component system response regulator WspF